MKPARYYKVEDEVNVDFVESEDGLITMEDVEDYARERWEDANPGTYSVTIWEYDNPEHEGKELRRVTITVTIS